MEITIYMQHVIGTISIMSLLKRRKETLLFSSCCISYFVGLLVYPILMWSCQSLSHILAVPRGAGLCWSGRRCTADMNGRSELRNQHSLN